jgi:aminoglycoside phosphotransferase (APT) family kinase protein
MHGGVSCSVHEVQLQRADGSRLRVVVRRYGQDWQHDTAASGREFRVLQVLSRAGMAVPNVLLHEEAGEVFGAPTLVISRLPGKPSLLPRNLHDYLRQLAAALAQVHAVPTDGLEFLPTLHDRTERHFASFPDLPEPLLREVREVAAALWPSIAVGSRLIHGDYWPGNTVWFRERMMGIIDWEMAGLGSPGKDVATCRCDITNLFDLRAADEFTRLYEEAAGEPVADLTFWDLQVATGAIRYIDHWSEGYRALGRTELSAPEAAARVASFARAALARAG